MRIIFAGTPEFASCTLQALISNNHTIVAAYTQPDRKSGRGQKLTQSPVKQLAIHHHIPVYQPKNFKSHENIEQLMSLKPDLMIVAAYGLILPESVLSIPRMGCINIHASLLPRWRGASPIQHAILANDNETGICIMKMDAGLDTGDILLKHALPITPHETAGSLHDKLASLGATSIIEALMQFDTLIPEKQDHSKATYAHKIDKADAEINWHEPAALIEQKIRAYNPWPICFTSLNDMSIRIYEVSFVKQNAVYTPGEIIQFNKDQLLVATGTDSIAIHKLQLPGGKPVLIRDLYNSKRSLFENVCFK